MKRSRDNHRGLAFVLALLLCGAFNAIHHQALKAHHADPITGTVRDAALVPGQTVTMRIGHWWHINIVSIFNGPRLAKQNEALRKSVLTLSAENQQLLSAQAENDKLRALLEFKRKSPRPLLAAEVSALKPNIQQETLTLNRGIHAGSHLQAIAIDPNGALLGQVTDISNGSSIVLLLSDIGSSVGAQVKSKAPHAPVGICRGLGSDQIQFTYPFLRNDEDIKAGDAVSTSGLGGVYPAGIPIGTIISVHVDQTRSIKTAMIRPAADFDHLEEAFLIR
jgi:rod shape-determining protein MreC